MRKNVFGRQFKRDANERKALFKNLLTSLVLKERIQTTEAKAKAIKGAADKLVTKAKKGGLHAYRHIEPQVNHNAVVKLLEEIAPRFTQRQGGYTRIIRGRRRVADNAQMVYLEWTEVAAVISPEVMKAKNLEKKSKDKKKKDAKAEMKATVAAGKAKKTVTQTTDKKSAAVITAKPEKKEVKKAEKKGTKKK